MIRKTLLQHTASINASLRQTAAPRLVTHLPLSHTSCTSPQRLRIPSRCYSASTARRLAQKADDPSQSPSQGEASAAEDVATEGTAQAEEAKKDADPKAEELEKKNKEIIDLKDRYMRSVADFRNLQDRTKREIQSAKDFALQRFSKDLLDSVDNLDRALSTVAEDRIDPSNKDLVNLHSGLKMTESILMQTLKKNGIERFDPSETREVFDPNLHEAMFMAPQPDKEDGRVFHTQQKGFLLNGRVLRAAKVGVVKNS